MGRISMSKKSHASIWEQRTGDLVYFDVFMDEFCMSWIKPLWKKLSGSTAL